MKPIKSEIVEWHLLRPYSGCHPALFMSELPKGWILLPPCGDHRSWLMSQSWGKEASYNNRSFDYVGLFDDGLLIVDERWRRVRVSDGWAFEPVLSTWLARFIFAEAGWKARSAHLHKWVNLEPEVRFQGIRSYFFSCRCTAKAEIGRLRRASCFQELMEEGTSSSNEGRYRKLVIGLSRSWRF
jgi:hypothetical protein